MCATYSFAAAVCWAVYEDFSYFACGKNKSDNNYKSIQHGQRDDNILHYEPIPMLTSCNSYKPHQQIINDHNPTTKQSLLHQQSIQQHNPSQPVQIHKLHEPIDTKTAFNVRRIRIILKECSFTDFAPTFAKYHSMNDKINGAASCWAVYANFSYFGCDNNGDDDDDDDDDDNNNGDAAYFDPNELELVGFTSILHSYGHGLIQTTEGTKEYHYREHRTVILPEYQGIGIGSGVADGIGEYLSKHGLRLQSKTAHPRYGGYR